MKIYLAVGARDHLMLVTPGADSDDCSDWRNPDGSLRQFKVQFKKGVASVPSNLGDYLIAKGVARKTPPLIVASQAHELVVMEQRVRRHRILAGV